jgi:hypothetical protein
MPSAFPVVTNQDFVNMTNGFYNLGLAVAMKRRVENRARTRGRNEEHGGLPQPQTSCAVQGRDHCLPACYYRRLFRDRGDGQLSGEASPTYSWIRQHPEVPER